MKIDERTGLPHLPSNLTFHVFRKLDSHGMKVVVEIVRYGGEAVGSAEALEVTLRNAPAKGIRRLAARALEVMALGTEAYAEAYDEVTPYLGIYKPGLPPLPE